MPDYPDVLHGLLIAMGNDDGLSKKATAAIHRVLGLVENEFCRADRTAYKQWAFELCRHGGPIWEPCEAWLDDGLSRDAYVWIDKELEPVHA